MAIRAVATAVGTGPEQVAALVRETGDLGQAAEQLLTGTAAGCHRRLHEATRVRAADVLYIARAWQRTVARTRPYRSR